MIEKIQRKLRRGWVKVADRLGMEVRQPAARYQPLVALRQLAGNQPIQTIFDVGANAGQSAQKFRQHFPTAQLHCFEPDPATFAQLAATLAPDAKSEAHRIALGDQDGTAMLFVNSESATNSFLANAPDPHRSGPHAYIKTVDQTPTPMQTLATFCHEQEITTIDLLKIDTQGYELHVLRGAETLLTPVCIRLIYLEALFYPLYEGQARFHEIQALLHEKGYRLYNFYEPAWSEQHGLLWADALFYGAQSAANGEGKHR